MAQFKVFVDGESGTTGLRIRQRIASCPEIGLLKITDDKRKDLSAKKELYENSDIVVLCLPDDAAREAVALADSMGDYSPRILDASTAFRVAEGWVYGFPEMEAEQPLKISRASRVSNPGCYPTGAVALLRPLVFCGLLPLDYPVSINAISGYSGGGKNMIEAYENHKAPPFELYGLTLQHKHIPEIQTYSGLALPPIFIPSVGNFQQGMLVSIPLHLDLLHGKPTAHDIEEILRAHYAGQNVVRVIDTECQGKRIERLEPDALNDTNIVELRVFSQPHRRQAVLVARLDNLGKGASGAAVQNIELMMNISR